MLNFIDGLHLASTGAASIFVGLVPSLPPLFSLVKYFCILLGVSLIMHSLMRLRLVINRYNSQEFRPIFFQIFAGVALINLNILIATGAETIFGVENHLSNPLSYSVETTSDWVTVRTKSIVVAIMGFIELVGYISVARGVVELNKHSLGKPNSSLGKGLTHIIGGILAANITLTTLMLASTFGLDDFI